MFKRQYNLKYPTKIIKTQQMSKTVKNSRWSFMKLLVVFTLFGLVMLTSELIYQLKHSHQHLFYSYFNNISVSSTPGFIGKFHNQLTMESLYAYFSYLDKYYVPPKTCTPFCLQYEEEQMYLSLFKKLLFSNSTKILTDNQKAKLYFWMASINIWHKNDQTTLDWLDKSLLLAPNDVYKQFYEDLRDISLIESDPDKREYFIRMLKPRNDKVPRYKRFYLAKASFSLALFFLNSQNLDQARKFAETAVALNPWNLDYYLLESDIHIKQNDLKKAKETLSECVVKIPKDSGLCEEKLIFLNKTS